MDVNIVTHRYHLWLPRYFVHLMTWHLRKFIYEIITFKCHLLFSFLFSYSYFIHNTSRRLYPICTHDIVTNMQLHMKQ